MSRGLVLIAGVLVALVVGGLAAAAGERRTQEPGFGPGAQAVFVINGRGWGHGVGMSQWGAHGLARHGADYRRILTHYYRETTIGRAPVAKVRVLLATRKPTLTIASEAPFRVRDGDGEVHALEARSYVLGPALRIRPKGAQRRTQLRPPLTFLRGDEPLRLERPYRGSIQVDRVGKRLRAINVVGLEQYLYGVVPAEVPDDWPAEVLKAQAVAARSYALATRKTSGAFDLFSDVRSQVYLGIDEEEDSTNDAVDATAGQVLLYGGRVVTTYFHSTSGGRTASIVDVWRGSRPVPYLVSVDDPYDSISPHHTWGPVVVPAARLKRVLRTPGRLVDVRTSVNPSARVDRVVGVGTQGESSAIGGDVRRELGLRSTWFRIGVLALNRPLRPHVWGGTSRLTGIARNLSGTQLERVGPTGWRVVAAVRPRADGTFSVAVRPTATSSYRLAGGGARTPTIQLPVAPHVRLGPVTDPMALRGSVRPVLAGAGVEIERQSGGVWGVVGRATVAPNGEFVAQMHVPAGTYRAVVPRPGRGLAPGMSATLVVRG